MLKDDGAVVVKFTLTDVERRAGAAVPQVYVGLGRALGGVQQAIRSVRSSERVYLEPGRTK